jgi:isopentenyldiphosphate isomerase
MRIPIVNEQDEIIGYKDKNERDSKEITRVSGLWVTDTEGKILLAQRSWRKKQDPGFWGPAVAGSVEEGETYESNIIKEAEEEIGLKNIIPILGPKHRRSTSHEYFCQWFSIVISKDTSLVRQEEEVEELRWFTPTELISFYESNPNVFLKNFDRYLKTFLNYEPQN